MRWPALTLMLILAVPGVLHPQALLRPGVAGPGLLCQQAIQAAERAHGVPAGLLAAMGRVESGRPDPRSGVLLPWPWTIDVEGQGAFFETAAEAITAVRASQARGVRSIDVGCLQVNLLHHPQAFTDLTQAFDPASNADYAARFLRDLFAQAGSWPQAAALYHSATPELGGEYRRRVLAAWPEEARRSQAAARLPVAFSSASPLPRAGSAALHHPFLARIPAGWGIAAHLTLAAAPPDSPACPFAAIVSCARVRPKASR